MSERERDRDREKWRRRRRSHLRPVEESVSMDLSGPDCYSPHPPLGGKVSRRRSRRRRRRTSLL